MSTSGVVIHYIRTGYQSPLRKYTILNENSVFDLHDALSGT